MRQDFILKFLKFCIVGGSGVIIDFGVTYVFKELLKINKYVSNSLGFLCAATSNYILNRVWTFSSSDPNVTRQYLTFLLISLVGLAINNAIIWLLNDRFKVNFSKFINKGQPEKINFYSSKLIAMLMVLVWNFLMNYFFTF